jgi:hypothetical protein
MDLHERSAARPRQLRIWMEQGWERVEALCLFTRW